MRVLCAFVLLSLVAGLTFTGLTAMQNPSGESISVLDVCSFASPADAYAAAMLAEPVFDAAPYRPVAGFPEKDERIYTCLIISHLEKPPTV
jgi:hypothetical protein